MRRFLHHASTHGVLAGAALACLTVWGCADKATGPQPVPYRLYVAMKGTPPTYQSYILAIDCATDSVVDSLPDDFLVEYGFLTCSPDGRYLATRTSSTRTGVAVTLWDLAARRQLGRLPNGNIVFVPDSSYLVASGRPLWVVDLPSLALIDSINNVTLTGIQPIPGSTRAIGLSFWNASGDPNLPSGSRIVIFDVARRVVVDSFPIDPFGDGQAGVARFTVSPDGKRLYTLGGDRQGLNLVGLDLLERRVLFRVPAEDFRGYCRVTPDNREVWMSNGGFNPYGYPWPEYISIFDAGSGALLDTIALDRATLNWPRPVSPQDIRFLPSGGKAYVNCALIGGPYTGKQPLVVIDTRSRKVTKVLFADATRYPQAIDLAPAP